MFSLGRGDDIPVSMSPRGDASAPGPSCQIPMAENNGVSGPHALPPDVDNNSESAYDAKLDSAADAADDA